MAINLRAFTQYNIKATSNTLALLYPPPQGGRQQRGGGGGQGHRGRVGEPGGEGQPA